MSEMRQRALPGNVVLRLKRAYHISQLSNRGVLEQCWEFEIYFERTRSPSDDLYAGERVATEFEEVGVEADGLDAEHLLPFSHQLRLDVIVAIEATRTFKSVALDDLGFKKESVSIKLTVSGDWELIEDDELGRHHRRREMSLDMLVEQHLGEFYIFDDDRGNELVFTKLYRYSVSKPWAKVSPPCIDGRSVSGSPTINGG
jgi:hypothetical protein